MGHIERKLRGPRTCMGKSNTSPLTPVERSLDGTWYKRDDYHAPLGLGKINGSKLRQAQWLCRKAKERGYAGIVSGAVAGSPQHPMVTWAAQQEGMSSLIVTAGSPKQHPMLSMAKDMGAEFKTSKVGYARTLDTISRRLGTSKNLFHLETNITVSERRNAPERVWDFHRIGGEQVKNLPSDIEVINIPAGSCNSATSVLVGIAENRRLFPALERIVLFGIGAFGSSDPYYIQKRLGYIGLASKIDYDGVYDFDTAGQYGSTRTSVGGRIHVSRYDLNGTGYCQYSDLMPCQRDGIRFHPRYEGKMMNYMAEFSVPRGEGHLIWVVGSEPK